MQSTPPLWTRGLITIAAITVAYLLAAVLAALAMGNHEFLLYAASTAVFALIVLGVHMRVRFSLGVLTCLSAWGALHMAGGLVPVPESWPVSSTSHVLYSLWLIPDLGALPGSHPDGGVTGYFKYDNFVHALGFGAVAWACWQGLVAGTGVTKPTVGLLTLCLAAAMGFGAVNEIIEFAATRLSDTNVGGYVNNAIDLIYNAVGAGVACGVIYGFTTRRGDAESE